VKKRHSGEQFHQPLAKSFEAHRPFRRALPNDQRTPAEFAQRPAVNLVAGRVAFEFLHPERAVVRRCRAIPATTMPMPEAPVNEDNGLLFCQHDVGFARQFLSVKAKAKTEPMKQRANALFGRCVLAANAAHVPGTALFAQSVVHVKQPIRAQLNWQFITRAIHLSCGSSSSTGLAAASVDLVVTDPPFFDNVHYSELADFFFAWQQLGPSPFVGKRSTTRHAEEVQDTSAEQFAAKLRAVFAESCRVL